MDYYLPFLIGALIILAVVLLLFFVVDKFLKGEIKFKKSSEDKPTEKPAEQPSESKTLPVMQIYNSELADDLNELLKNSETKSDSRLNAESHVVESGNISKYFQEKKYHDFNFSADGAIPEDEEPMTFTREDYKKFMALSNINDQK